MKEMKVASKLIRMHAQTRMKTSLCSAVLGKTLKLRENVCNKWNVYDIFVFCGILIRN